MRETLENKNFEQKELIKGWPPAVLPLGSMDDAIETWANGWPGQMTRTRVSQIPMLIESLVTSGEITKAELSRCPHEQSSFGREDRKIRVRVSEDFREAL